MVTQTGTVTANGIFNNLGGSLGLGGGNAKDHILYTSTCVTFSK